MKGGLDSEGMRAEVATAVREGLIKSLFGRPDIEKTHENSAAGDLFRPSLDRWPDAERGQAADGSYSGGDRLCPGRRDGRAVPMVRAL
jgi:hypothetical protein